MVKSLNIRNPYVIAFLLGILTLAVYWQVTTHDFTNYDDNLYVTDNEHVKAGLTAESILWAFTTGHSANWHPLTWLSHMIDVELFGMNAGRHHLMSVLMHIANALLLFNIFKRMTGKLWQSAFVAALFALHPLHIESVAWAAERKDVLSTLFWMLTMWAYIRYAEHPGVAMYLSTVLFFALGLMAKPMLVTLPFVMLLLDYWPLGRLRLNGPDGATRISDERTGGSAHQRQGLAFLVREKIPFFALAIVSSVITFIAQKGGGSVSSFDSLPFNLRFANAFVSYVAYVKKMFWPSGLTVFYPHPYDALPAWEVGGSVFFLLCISVLLLWVARKKPFAAVGWIWYVGTLVPVIGVVQVGAQSMADRYTYVPLIGLFLIISWSVPDLLKKWKHWKIGLALTAAAIMLALATTTFAQVSYWHDSIRLFEEALRVTTGNWIASQNLGFALASKEKYLEAIPHYEDALTLRPKLEEVHRGLAMSLSEVGRIDEAFAHFNEALRIKPDYAEAHYGMARTYAEQGDLNEAIDHYSRALRFKPDYAEAHNNLGVLIGSQGRTQEALVHFSEALRLKPDFADAHNNIGIVLAKEGNLTEAISHYSESLRIKPDNADARRNLDLAFANQRQMRETPQRKPEAVSAEPDSAVMELNKGLSLYNERKLTEAIPYFRNALRLRPDYWEASYNLGVTYHNLGRLKEAIEYYSIVVRAKPDYAEAQYNLGVAFHSQGNVDEAITRYREAIRLKPDHAQAHNNLGVAFYSKGNYKEAANQYQKAIEIRPDYEEARKNLEVTETVSQGQNIILTPQPKKQ